MHDKELPWGLYPWFEEHGANMIHPEDLLLVRAITPSGKVFQKTGEDGDFIRLRYGTVEFRAKPSLFCLVDATIHGIGTTVSLEDGGRGEVTGIHWHHQRSEPMYELRVEGKKTSRRYWNSDFTVFAM